MSNITLTWVADEHREYDTQHGRKAAFKVKLEDGSLGEVTTNAEIVGKRMEEFRSFVGKPTELIVEDGGKWPDGNPKPVKVKKPQQQDGGGAGKSSWYNSEEGVRFTQERTDRRTALMQAVALASIAPVSDHGVVRWSERADGMYAWLRESASSAHPSGSAADTGSPTPLSGEPGHSAGIQGRSAEETGGAAGKGTGEGPKPAAPTCPACDSPNIGRKGRTWKCGDCEQDWEAR